MRAQRAGQSALLLLDVVEVLDREAVDYAVIGAFALSVLGVVRATTDVDALLFVSHRRLTELGTLFQDMGLAVELRRGGEEDPISNLLVLGDAYGNHVELLGGLRGMDPELFSRTLTIPLRDQRLKIVGREDFIAMKCFAGGPQDILDARSAFEAAQGPIDIDLVRTLTRRFGREAADKLEQVLAR